jgi:ubiquitin carboxyl-terminal hydrolase 7
MRLDKEREDLDAKRRDDEERMLNMNVRVFSDDDIRHYEGFDLANFPPHSKSSPQYNVGVGETTHHVFRVLKTETYGDFRARVSQEYRIPEEGFKLWNMVGRQNRTIRPDVPLIELEKSMWCLLIEEALEQVRDNIPKGGNQQDLKLYLEIPDKELGSDLFAPPAEDDIVVFLKYFNVDLQKIEYVRAC